MRVLIVIPARGGSTRVPRKNLEQLTWRRNGWIRGGDTLLSRACNQAVATGYEWTCSTDDAETASHIRYWFGEMFVCERTGYECGDVPVVRAIQGAQMRASLDDDGRGPDTVLLLQPTSPLRVMEDIRESVRLFEHSGTRSLVSVNESTGQRNGAVYITRVEMLRDGLVFDDDSLKYPMPASRSLDINTPADLEEARRILGP